MREICFDFWHIVQRLPKAFFLFLFSLFLHLGGKIEVVFLRPCPRISRRKWRDEGGVKKIPELEERRKVVCRPPSIRKGGREFYRSKGRNGKLSGWRRAFFWNRGGKCVGSQLTHSPLFRIQFQAFFQIPPSGTCSCPTASPLRDRGPSTSSGSTAPTGSRGWTRQSWRIWSTRSVGSQGNGMDLTLRRGQSCCCWLCCC